MVDGCNLGLFLPWDCILIQAMCGKLMIQWAVVQTLLHAEKAICCSGSICPERQSVPSFIHNRPYRSWPSTGKKQKAISQCYWPQKEAVGSPFLHRQLSDAEDEHLDFQHRSQGFLTKKVITTIVTDYSLDLEYIMRTDILSERKRWGELISQNWVETVGQLTEDAQSNKSRWS